MADINIGQITEALNDKTDLDFNNMNPSATAKQTIVGWGMPDYSAGVSITANSDYTCLANGFVFVTHYGTSGSGTLTVNGTNLSYFQSVGAGSRDCLFVPVAEGDIVKYTLGSGSFFPCRN